MREKVILLDASEILTIIRRAGSGENPVQGLNAIANRGDKFFFGEDFQSELDKAGEWNSPSGEMLRKWLSENADRIVEIDPVDGIDEETGIPEEDLFDPEGKRKKSGGEIADMSIRKFMWRNRNRYDFEVISSDIGLLDNNFVDGHPLNTLKFERLSTRSALTWLSAHPDVPFTKDKFTALRSRIANGSFDLSEQRGLATHPLESETYELPKSYKHSLHLKKVARFQRISKRFGKLVKDGAPVVLVGLVAPLVYSKLNEYAEERNISFGQAAMELGLDFTEDDLKALAADVGLDLAVSLTPVGALKKAWDVLGNIDDIVAVTQLYGEAYPDNQVIQELAEVARTVESSEAFEAYLYGRDALTGAVTSVIDGIFGDNEEDEKKAEDLAGLRASLQDDGAAAAAANGGATQEELAETLRQEVRNRKADRKLFAAERQSLFGATPAASVKTPLKMPHPDATALSAETVLPDGARVSVPQGALLPGSEPIPGPTFQRGEGQTTEGAEPGSGSVPGRTPAPDGARPADGAAPGSPAAQGVGVGTKSEQPLRKTSYDLITRIGRTPEEAAQAVEEYKVLFKQSFLDMNGDMEAAKLLATERLKRKWSLSSFSPDEEGTVIRHPVETVYADLEDDGHGYVREDAEALLKQRGLAGRTWYLAPNGKTGSDHDQGWMDDAGYGPRMTLSIRDESGGLQVVSDSFQANVARANQRRWEKRDREAREQIARLGLGGAATVSPPVRPGAGKVPVPREKPQAPEL